MSKHDQINQRKTHSTNVKAKEDVLIVAPKAYQGLKDESDDYDISAKLMQRQQQDPKLKKLVQEHIDGEDLFPYGPATSYKSRYTYNRDD